MRLCVTLRIQKCCEMGGNYLKKERVVKITGELQDD